MFDIGMEVLYLSLQMKKAFRTVTYVMFLEMKLS